MTQNYNSNNPNHSHITSNTNQNNATKFNSSSFFNNDDSLLLNDVYGKDYESPYENDLDKNVSGNCNNNSNYDLSSFLNSFFQKDKNSNSNNDSTNNFFNDSGMPDMETLLKLKKIFERLNSNTKGNDPIINLLFAIKPFIQESKKSIIDQLTKFISISSVLQDFSNFL